MSEKEKLLKIMAERMKYEENKSFGEFIVQTNKVQFYLAMLIRLYSSFPDKVFYEHIERIEFGSLINLFCACSRSPKLITGKLIFKLRKYKKQRDRLAHKMYTDKKLTKKECEQAIADGKKISKTLFHLLGKIIPY